MRVITRRERAGLTPAPAAATRTLDPFDAPFEPERAADAPACCRRRSCRHELDQVLD